MLARFMMSKTFMGFSRSAVRIFSRSVIAVPRFGDADVAQQIREYARPTTALRSCSNGSSLREGAVETLGDPIYFVGFAARLLNRLRCRFPCAGELLRFSDLRR